MMRMYQVWLKGMTRFVEVSAEDVNLDNSADVAYYNFTVYKNDDISVTVALFPYEGVEYVVPA
jgi:hypothetical protein